MATWTDAQHRRRRRIVGRTREEAEAVLAKLIRDRDLERHGMGLERGLSMPVSDLFAAYLADLRARARPKSVDEARAGLARIARDMGARTVRDLTAPAVIAWRDGRVAAGAANKTANTEVGYLRAALGHAVRLGLLGQHPLAGLRGLPVGSRHQRRRPRALSDWELRRLFAAADELDRDAKPPVLPRAPLLRALALTGARWGELTSATWADLDPERGTLTLRGETTKNGRGRTIPLAAPLLDELLTLPAIYAARLGRRPSASSPIFLSPEGRSWARGRSNFYRWICDAFSRASIPHTDELGRVVHVHALRHTFATRLARAGVSLAKAQLLTGHRSASILLAVYTHLESEEARGALECLPSLGVGSIQPGAAPSDQSSSDDGARRAQSHRGRGEWLPG